MRKSIIFLFAIVAMLGCQEDLQDNSPAYQGIRDGTILWRANGNRVFVNADGYTVIEGTMDDERLRLIVPQLNLGTYTLGSSSTARATLLDGPILFSTEFDGVGSPVFLSDGEIVIENVSDNRVDGSFRFNAYDATGQMTVNFIDGVLFRIFTN